MINMETLELNYTLNQMDMTHIWDIPFNSNKQTSLYASWNTVQDRAQTEAPKKAQKMEVPQIVSNVFSGQSPIKRRRKYGMNFR